MSTAFAPLPTTPSASTSVASTTTESIVLAPTPLQDYLLRIADTCLIHAQRGHHDFGAIDWSEFWQVVNGEGPCNKERLAERVDAWNDGEWVREAALAHARKSTAREHKQAA